MIQIGDCRVEFEPPDWLKFPGDINKTRVRSIDMFASAEWFSAVGRQLLVAELEALKAEMAVLKAELEQFKSERKEGESI